MSSDKELRRWVSDKLHGVLGFAENHLSDYIVSLAKSAKTPATLLTKLHEADVPKSDTTTRFAAELFGRVPRASSSKADDSVRERREAVGLQKQNATYGFVEADGDEDDDGAADINAAVQRKLQEKEKERKRAERKRARAESSSGTEQQQKAAGEAGASSADPDAERDQLGITRTWHRARGSRGTGSSS